MCLDPAKFKTYMTPAFTEERTIRVTTEEGRVACEPPGRGCGRAKGMRKAGGGRSQPDEAGAREERPRSRDA